MIRLDRFDYIIVFSLLDSVSFTKKACLIYYLRGLLKLDLTGYQNCTFFGSQIWPRKEVVVKKISCFLSTTLRHVLFAIICCLFAKTDFISTYSYKKIDYKKKQEILSNMAF